MAYHHLNAIDPNAVEDCFQLSTAATNHRITQNIIISGRIQAANFESQEKSKVETEQMHAILTSQGKTLAFEAAVRDSVAEEPSTSTRRRAQLKPLDHSKRREWAECVPIELAIKTIEKKWNILEQYTNIPRGLFIEILKFFIKDTRYFKYEEKFYSQQKGLPMGSPASPAIAYIVMEDLLDDSIGKMPNKPKILTKYVDDLFGIIKKTETINTINVLNSYNKLIQFTMEEENDNKLAYLDTIVIRKENRILLDWYQKDTASRRLVNFHSKHPKSMIINTANNFINRVLTISDEIYHHQNKQKIRDILLMNDFPKKTIKDLLKRAQKPKKDNINKEPKIYKSVTFIPGFSERFKNSEIYDKDKIQLAFRTHNSMDQFYGKTKSKVKKEDKSNLVYQIKCNGDGSDICQKVYVGNTGTKLKTRISHKSDHKARDKPLDQKTALANHCTQTGHSPNFDDVDVLVQESNPFRRYTLEMLYITDVPSEKRLNFKTDTDKCSQICQKYLPIIRQCRPFVDYVTIIVDESGDFETLELTLPIGKC
ncbi:uncharacterized protein LOC142225146 [Haematobia irritans]|uniref:uncharacterized protein LOC142225146 n=1 Tax=Haematobia irritans TaxID=7368 RepID=UPI003F4FBE51